MSRIKDSIKTAGKYFTRNSFIMNDTNRPVIKKSVNLHWWKRNKEQDNVGDLLSSIVVQWMKEKNGIESDRSIDNKTKHLFAIGTILDMSYQNATVWGSGLPEDKLYWWRKLRKLNIKSVRGPLTRTVLLKNGYSCPEVYGDPAILMPFIYEPVNKEKKYKSTVIFHHTFDCKNETSFSPITSDYKAFIDRIVQSELVISSSLHGIILAEVYGVPAIMLNNSAQSDFKYRDWYYSTGRKDIPIANTIEEALAMTPAPLPNVTSMQKQIIDAFPIELWK